MATYTITPYSGFSDPFSISVYPADGSVWVADAGNDRIVKLSAAGAILWQSGASAYVNPVCVSVNTADGTCWAGVKGTHSSGTLGQVVHFSAAGAVLWQTTPGTPFTGPGVSVNSADGSCWVADFATGYVIHLSSAGATLWQSSAGQFIAPSSICVNPTDNSVWVADSGRNQLIHLAANGTELFRSALTGSNNPWGDTSVFCVSVNSADNSVWVKTQTYLVHLSSAGATLWQSSAAYGGNACSVDASTGKCWDASYSDVALLTSAGAEIWQGLSPMSFPWAICANPSDGSAWAADLTGAQVVHIQIVLANAWAPVFACLLMWDGQGKEHWWRRRYARSYEFVGMCSAPNGTVYGLRADGSMVNVFGGTTDYAGDQVREVWTAPLAMAESDDERTPSSAIVNLKSAAAADAVLLQFAGRGRVNTTQAIVVPISSTQDEYAGAEPPGTNLGADGALKGNALQCAIIYQGSTPPTVYEFGALVDDGPDPVQQQQAPQGGEA